MSYELPSSCIMKPPGIPSARKSLKESHCRASCRTAFRLGCTYGTSLCRSLKALSSAQKPRQDSEHFYQCIGVLLLSRHPVLDHCAPSQLSSLDVKTQFLARISAELLPADDLPMRAICRMQRQLAGIGSEGRSACLTRGILCKGTLHRHSPIPALPLQDPVAQPHSITTMPCSCLHLLNE